MKRLKTLMLTALTLMTAVAFLPSGARVQAASKKSVYVVTKIKVMEGKSKTTIKLTYNKTGLLKTIDSPIVDEKSIETFTYNKNNQLIKMVDDSVFHGEKNHSVFKYSWKKGRKVSKTEIYDGNPILLKYTYNSKGQIVSETGGMGGKTTYKYKMGQVFKSDNEQLHYKANLDKKGNATSWTRTYYNKNEKKSEKIGYCNARFTYKSGRVKKLTKTFKNNPMQDKERTQTRTFIYKKISVPKKLADSIADQQWKLINETEGFAW